MKADMALIMAIHLAVLAIHPHCMMPLVLPAMMAMKAGMVAVTVVAMVVMISLVIR